MQEYDWVKVSLMTGVKTNVVTAVEIDERYGAGTARSSPPWSTDRPDLHIRRSLGRRGVPSYENMERGPEHGGTPYIAFKSNTTAVEGGTLAKMFHLYNFNRDDYLSHYHKRSNVETTFWMIKAKFGDHLRSQDGHGDGQRGAVQDPLPQHLLPDPVPTNSESRRHSGGRKRIDCDSYFR